MNILSCIIIADLITGFFHWLEDTYCLEDYPIVGKLICEPNIDHHINPSETFKEGGFVARNYLQWSLAAVVGLLLWPISWQFALILFISSWGNEVHAWQHGAVNNGFTKFMFDSGMVQQPANHNRHHKPPYMQNYCILLSFNNAWMDRIKFWRGLEWFIGLFGLRPKRESRRDRVGV